jgi:non-ribosomal peptide synthase protein (TIGR01720 family)
MAPSTYTYLEHRLSSRDEIPAIVATAQTGLGIERGPVFRVDLFDLADQSETVISMVAHHLCIDMVSWRIIVQDLGQLLETGSLPADTPLSFRSWCAQQSAHDKTVNTETLLPYKESQHDLSYWGIQGPLTYGSTDTQVFSLSEETTKLALVDCHKAFRSEPVDLFLAAILHAFVEIFQDRSAPTFHIENHGREAPKGSDIDLSRTVGWFTTICPLVIPLRAGENDMLGTVRRSKDIRRSIPGHGRPYFAHKHLAEKPGAMWSPMEVLFNYLGGGVGVHRQGDTDSLVREVDLDGIEGFESPRIADVGPETRRLALFEITAVVVNNRLQFRFSYDSSLSRAGDVRRWIGTCKNILEDMTRSLMQRPAEPTLSDYPLLPLTYDTLRTLTNISLPRAGIDRASSFSQVEDIYPCTPVQEGMLISQLRNPSAYIFHAIYNVKHTDPHHQLDAKKIARVWQRVVDRHAALRTVFIESMRRDGVFDQVVLNKVDSGALLLSSSDKEAMAKLSQVDMRTAQQPQLPHQLAICTTHSGRVLVKLEVNHAAMDGGSLAIVLEELASAYRGTLEVAPGALYSDYVQYINALPVGEDSGYWARYLKGLCPCYFPSLGASNTTLASETRSLRSVALQFNRYAELRRLSEQMHVTLANMMHAAWAFVLRKYTKSDDVCFGYLTAGRDAPVENIDRIIGTLINMLCCRVQISTSQTLENIFRTAQDQHLESVPFQHCSLARVQHELGLAGKSLYNTSISTQNNSKGEETGVEETISFEMEEGHDPSEVRTRPTHTTRLFLVLLSLTTRETSTPSRLALKPHRIMRAFCSDTGPTISATTRPKRWPVPWPLSWSPSSTGLHKPLGNLTSTLPTKPQSPPTRQGAQ